MIFRQSYIEELKKVMWDGNIKVITGIRRCGKSVLLFDLFKEHLISLGVSKETIIEIKLDEDDNIKYRNPIILSKYLKKKIGELKNTKVYVFIDEVQLSSPKTDRSSGVKMSIFDVLNGLRNNPNIDVYVTGSNSKMLSKDILTEFRGRSTQIRVHPFSFKEFYDYRGGDKNKCLDEYLVLGGPDDEEIDEEDYWETDDPREILAYAKDMIGRYGNRDVHYPGLPGKISVSSHFRGQFGLPNYRIVSSCVNPGLQSWFSERRGSGIGYGIIMTDHVSRDLSYAIYNTNVLISD